MVNDSITKKIPRRALNYLGKSKIFDGIDSSHSLNNERNRSFLKEKKQSKKIK